MLEIINNNIKQRREENDLFGRLIFECESLNREKMEQEKNMMNSS